MKLRSIPCKCGWKFIGDHICVDPERPLDPAVARKHGIRLKGAGPISAVTDEQREAFEEYSKQVSSREAEMIARYMDGFGIKKISDDLGAGNGTVAKVLKRAEEAGVLKVRARGVNNRFRAHQEA